MATRRERVVLSLDDEFTPGMARAAAAAALLSRELNSLDGSSRRTARGSDDLNTSSDRLRTTLSRQDSALQNSGRQIDRYSGRLALVGQALSLLGPASIPLAAVTVPAVAGLATQLGFAAAAGGTMVLAFQGVGTALTAVNKASLEPTTANLQAAQLAMEQISPAAANLVTQLHGLGDEFHGLRDAAAEGAFPGLSEALDTLETRIPEVERLLGTIGRAVGDTLAASASDVASARWDVFFNFLQTQSRTTLVDLATSVGNVAHAAAEMISAFSPLSQDFSGWLVDATAQLDRFATGLGQTQGFQEFVAYIRENGPQVGATLGAIAQAALDIVEAAAPIGGPVLQGLEALAKVVSTIADSDLGTPLFGLAAGLSALSLAQRGLVGLRTSLTGLGTTLGTTFTPIAAGAQTAAGGVRGFTRDLSAMRGEYTRMGAASAVVTSAMSNTTAAAQRTRASLVGVGKTAAVLGGLALVTSGVAGGMGLANTASLALAGTMLGGPWGAAIGGGVGLVLDFKASQDSASEATANLTATLNQQTGAITSNTRAAVAKQLQDQGILDQAEAVGLSLSDVTSAALGNEAAYNRLNQALARSTQLDALSNRGTAEQSNLIVAVMESVQGLSGGLAEGAVKTRQLAAAQRTGGDAAERVTKSFAELGAEALKAADSASQLSSAITSVLTPGLNLSEATDALRAGLRHLDEEFAKGNKSLQGNTDAADQNRKAIRDQVSAIEAVLSKQAEAGASSEELARTLAQQTTALINTGVAAGLSSRELRGYLKQLGLTPKMIETVIRTTNLAKTRGDVIGLQAQYDLLPRDVKTAIRTDGIPKSKADIIDLQKKYDLTPEQVKTLVALSDEAAIRGINTVSALLRQLDGQTANTYVNTIHKDIHIGGRPPTQFASGGLVTGPGSGTSDSIPARLSNREFVQRAAAVDKYGLKFMQDVNALRFATGGQAVRAATTAGSAVTEMRVSGTLHTPWGPATIEGIATDVARSEIVGQERFNRTIRPVR